VAYGAGTTEYMRSVGGYALTLECGQHEDPAGPEIARHAIRQAIAVLGLADLPLEPRRSDHECLSLCEVVDRDEAVDAFVREWRSFDRLRQGDVIARRADGRPLVAPFDGRIVFPDVGALPGREWYCLARGSRRPL
jgi:hypothetical protein